MNFTTNSTANSTYHSGGGGEFEKAQDWTAFIASYPPVMWAALAVMVDWIITILATCGVFCMGGRNPWYLNLLYAVSSGSIIATATIGLIDEALERARQTYWSRNLPWIPLLVGLVIGVLLIQGVMAIAEWLQQRMENSADYSRMRELDGVSGDEKPLSDDVLSLESSASNGTTRSMAARVLSQPTSAFMSRKIRRVIMLVITLILQQVPEGLLIGIAFGNIPGADDKNRAARVALGGAIGGWITSSSQGVGMAVPLRSVEVTRTMTFLYVQLGCVLEMLAAVAGALSVTYVQAVLPFGLAAAGGAMLFTVCSELLPAAYESHSAPSSSEQQNTNDQQQRARRSAQRAKHMIINATVMGSFCFMLVLINLFGQPPKSQKQ